MQEFLFEIHRPLTAAPVTLVTVVVMLEVVNLARPSKTLRSVARVNLLIFFASLVVVFLSGFLAAEKYHAEPLSEISFHYNLSRLLIITAVPCAALWFVSENAAKGKSVFMMLYYFSLLLMFSVTVYTSYAGSLVTRKACELSCGKEILLFKPPSAPSSLSE